MSLGGFHTQSPSVTGLDGRDICSIQEGQKNNRAIVPLASNAKAPKQSFASGDSGYLVKWKNCQREESPVREPEPAMAMAQ